MYMEKLKKMNRMDGLFKYILTVGMVCLLVIPGRAQTAVTGTVHDVEGNSLPGVTIQLKGTTVATTTTSNGTFNISAPPTGTLVFSKIGYGRHEHNINNMSSLDINMENVCVLID